MNTTFLAVGVPFFVVGLVFTVTGDDAVGATFLVLGLVFGTMGVTTDGDRRDERA